MSHIKKVWIISVQTYIIDISKNSFLNILNASLYLVEKHLKASFSLKRYENYFIRKKGQTAI